MEKKPSNDAIAACAATAAEDGRHDRSVPPAKLRGTPRAASLSRNMADIIERHQTDQLLPLHRQGVAQATGQKVGMEILLFMKIDVVSNDREQNEFSLHQT